jgi:hypothetical protein
MQTVGNDGEANPDQAAVFALMRAGRRLLWTLINDTVQQTVCLCTERCMRSKCTVSKCTCVVPDVAAGSGVAADAGAVFHHIEVRQGALQPRRQCSHRIAAGDAIGPAHGGRPSRTRWVARNDLF